MSDSDWMENLVEEHLSNWMFGTEMLAEQMNVSPLHLRLLTQRYFAMTPVQFIDSRRLQRAAMLLCRFEHPYEVCRLVGYPCMRLFRRSFARCYHMTPAEFQAKLRQIEEQGGLVWDALLSPAMIRSIDATRGVS
ncbi:MAG TPA: helix-turn-helix transcriptional regulator [bacterium]|nr:helix-turn-helix transcriptional regulator [bacterium]HPN35501.1 helix-turn-helix transcriptional regulator [bacterium]